MTCILQEDRASPSTEQVKATGQGIHLGNGKHGFMFPRQRRRGNLGNTLVVGCNDRVQRERSTPLHISIEKAFGKKSPKVWHLGG